MIVEPVLKHQPSEETRVLKELPDLLDSNRNHALKRLVDIFSDKEVKQKVFTRDPVFEINSQII